MINLFYYDLDKYDIISVKNMFDTIQSILPEDTITLALPKDTYFYENVSLDQLYYIRKMIDEAIDKHLMEV